MEIQLKKGPPDNPRFVSAVKEAADFLQNSDNTKKKWRGLTYQQTLNLVKGYILSVKPGLDLENLSVETLGKILNDILSQEDIASVVPQNLEQLLKELEEAEGKAEIFEQRAAQKVEAYIETIKKQADKTQYKEQLDKLAAKISSQLVQEIPEEKRNAVAKVVIEEIPVDSSYFLVLDKQHQLSPEEQVLARKEITKSLQDSFSEAVLVAVNKLKDQEVIISAEEEQVLLRVQPSEEDLALIAAEIEKPLPERKLMVKWVADRLSAPLAEEELSFSAEPSPAPIPPDKIEAVVRAVVEELQPSSSLLASLSEPAGLPPEERAAAERKIANEVQEALRESVSKAIEKLEDQGVNISVEETKTLQNIQLPKEELSLFVKELVKPSSEREKVTQLLTEELSVSPIPQKTATTVTLVLSAMTGKLPEYDVPTLEKITPEEFASLQIKFREAAVAALAEVAPEIAKTSEFPPEKITQLVAAFVPQNIEELKERAILLTTPLEKRNISPLLPPLEPTEVTQLAPKNPPLIAPFLKRASWADPLEVTDEKGVRFVDELDRILHKQGINKTVALNLSNEVHKKWALLLTAQNIIPEDIQKTIEILVQGGEKEDSPRIKELNEIKKSLANFQEQLPKGLLQKIRKGSVQDGQKGTFVPATPSRFQTPIKRQSSFNPNLNFLTKLSSWGSRIFGKKIAITGSGQPIIISKLSFLKNNLLQSLKTRFFQTSFGKGIKISLQNLGQKSLQALSASIKTGAKQVVVKGITSLFTKLGFQAGLQALGSLAPGIGNLAAFVAGTLIQKGISLFTSVPRLISGIFTGSAAEMVSEYEEKMKKYAMIGAAIGCALLFFLAQNEISNLNSSFLGKGGGWEEELGVPPFPEVEPQCQNTRHLAEDIICQLSRRPPDCTENRVREKTWTKIASCFDSSTLQRKDEIKAVFGQLVEYKEGMEKTLQCVGFVLGTEAGFGRNAQRPGGGDAKDYIDSPYPAGYEFIDGKKEPQKGDIAIWTRGTYGHLAIVIDIIKPTIEEDGEIQGKMIIAQANGQNGMISVKTNLPFGQPDFSTNPQGYLRPK